LINKWDHRRSLPEFTKREVCKQQSSSSSSSSSADSPENVEVEDDDEDKQEGFSATFG
jgi:hypothetical protein